MCVVPWRAALGFCIFLGQRVLSGRKWLQGLAIVANNIMRTSDVPLEFHHTDRHLTYSITKSNGTARGARGKGRRQPSKKENPCDDRVFLGLTTTVIISRFSGGFWGWPKFQKCIDITGTYKKKNVNLRVCSIQCGPRSTHFSVGLQLEKKTVPPPPRLRVCSPILNQLFTLRRHSVETGFMSCYAVPF